ncbi:MAG TPA: hypothetical protein DD670_06265, partial [Planctomycetaceae bacterium]|nr:hypothetical protein [Planctomycetaceae bacterium]
TPLVSGAKPPIDATTAAGRLAEQLEARGRDYALGGAIALGYWSAPRGTVDVDLTIFLPPDRPTECIALLQELDCEFGAIETTRSLREHGYCSVKYAGMRLDVFLPTIPFYEAARTRRRRMELANRPVMVWDAESLAVFKMIFFRRKDLADVEQVLRTQGDVFDRIWVREHLVAMYGARDPRLSAWDEISREVPP